MNTSLTDEMKLDISSDKALCRCCLSSDRRMLGVEFFETHFAELASIDISESNDLPKFVCYECAALLQRAVHLKYKMLRAQEMFYEYLSRCAPFNIDNQEELAKLANPALCVTKTLTIDNKIRKTGFHKALEHEKMDPAMTWQKVELTMVSSDHDVKSELDFSDYEDNKPLGGNRSTSDNDKKSEIKLEVNKVKPKVQRVTSKVQKRKLVKVDKSIDKEAILKKYLPKPVKFDPEKIRVISLNPQEQIKQREEESIAGLKFLYRCELCFQGFNFDFKLEYHMLKHDPARGPHKCQVCSVHTPTERALRTHLLIHSRRYECAQCGVRMMSPTHIQRHYQTEHEGIRTVYPCEVCGKECQSRKAYLWHMKSKHRKERSCSYCGTVVKDKDALSEHVKTHEKAYKCDQCDKKYCTRFELKQHQVKHSEDKSFYCVECDRRFGTAGNLQKHLQTGKHREGAVEKTLSCPHCGKMYERSYDLNHHVRVQHEGVRSFPCELCGKRLATKGALKFHILGVHNGVRPPAKRVCETCGKAFPTMTALRIHVRTHTGEKPFECGECGRRFSQRSSMKTHVKLVHLKLGRDAKIKSSILAEDATKIPFKKQKISSQ